MQMFVLDCDPGKSAQYLCDAHVRVICREVTMLLSSWYWWNFPEMRNLLPYSPMSKNQPLAMQMDYIPVRRWAVAFAGEVFREFRFRFGKEHASKSRYDGFVRCIECFDPQIELVRNPFGLLLLRKGKVFFPAKQCLRPSCYIAIIIGISYIP